jgi:hypothetical protein
MASAEYGECPCENVDARPTYQEVNNAVIWRPAGPSASLAIMKQSLSMAKYRQRSGNRCGESVNIIFLANLIRH